MLGNNWLEYNQSLLHFKSFRVIPTPSMFTKQCVWAQGLLLMLAFLLVPATAFAQPPAADGYWLQIDDNDGRPLSIIRVDSKDGRVFGRVEEIFHPRNMVEPRCHHCTGINAGKPIRGMQILSGTASGEREWNGTILDPASGKEYKCTLKLAKDGKTLKVRGYIGMEILGRTQVWRRYGSL